MDMTPAAHGAAPLTNRLQTWLRGEWRAADVLSEGTALKLVAAFTALAAALRFYGVDSQLWYDEVKTLLLSVRPGFPEIVTHFESNNHHPLYSVLAHFSISAFGEHPWSLRLPAVLFGVASVPMLYVFAASSAGRLAATLSAGLLAVSYHHIAFSQNARGYTMLLFFTLLTSWLLLKALKEPSARLWVFYAIAATLGAYTHLTMVYIVAGHGLVVGANWLATMKSRVDFRPLLLPFIAFALYAVLTLGLYAPYFAGLQSYVEAKSGGASAQIATPLWAAEAALLGVTQGFGGPVGAALSLTLLAVGAIGYLRRAPLTAMLFFAPAPLMMASMLVLGHAIRPRFLFVLGGFVILTIVRGAMSAAAAGADRIGLLGRVGGTAVAAVIVLLVGAISLASLPAGYATPKQDLAGAIADVESRRQPGEEIYLAGGAAVVVANDYYGRGWPQLKDAAAFDEIARPFWIVFTFRDYLVTGAPDLWAVIQSNCKEVSVFKATIGDGESYVMKCAPSA